MSNIQSTKVCNKCGSEKPLDDFPKVKVVKSGRGGRCKPCVNAYQQEWRAAKEDADKRREYDAAYYEQNRERIAERKRKYRAENADLIREQNRIYNQSRDRAYDPDYYRKNVHKLWAQHYVRRANAMGMPVVVEMFTKADLFREYGDSCYWCGGPFEELDHFPPIAHGGVHTLATVRPSCQPCNRKNTGIRRTDNLEPGAS